jgi:hypothetical protein
VQRLKWSMQGGANAELGRFAPTVEAARSGWLNHWLNERSVGCRWSSFSTSFHEGFSTVRQLPFRPTRPLCRSSSRGLENRHFNLLEGLWERFFFCFPMVHSEGADHLARIRRLISIWESIAAEVPEHLRPLQAGALGRARTNLEVIAEFGRFPRRNAALRRRSTSKGRPYRLRRFRSHAVDQSLTNVACSWRFVRGSDQPGENG